jgi:hypothetical protein
MQLTEQWWYALIDEAARSHTQCRSTAGRKQAGLEQEINKTGEQFHGAKVRNKLSLASLTLSKN